MQPSLVALKAADYQAGPTELSAGVPGCNYSIMTGDVISVTRGVFYCNVLQLRKHIQKKTRLDQEPAPKAQIKSSAV